MHWFSRGVFPHALRGKREQEERDARIYDALVSAVEQIKALSSSQTKKLFVILRRMFELVYKVLHIEKKKLIT